jgi:two-component system sensor histidine kinase SenX3
VLSRAYDRGVSTAQIALTVVAVAVFSAAVVLAWRSSERERSRVPPEPEPVVPPGVASVLTVLRSSAVLVGVDDVVLTATAPTYVLGVMSGNRLVPSELQELVAMVRRDGQIREGELVIPRARSLPRYMHARVAPLGARLVLVLLEDRTLERRVETVRRDFVANVSHELKTPVGALHLLAEAVVEAAEDPEAVRRFAGRMQHESLRLERLVQQIIELSRLQGDQLVDEPVEVDVPTLLDAAVVRSRTGAEVKGITIHVQAEPPLEVLGDPDQLQAAIGNLVENAVTYGRPGSRVAVVARTVGDQVQVAVSDQGVGIPEAELDRIFERFYRVDPARARTTGGTGLGLSIVKHVAASHGGEVTVWSEPEQGSTFTLCLPVQRLGRPEARVDEPRTSGGADDPPAPPGPRDPVPVSAAPPAAGPVTKEDRS